ncbi:hypothetical protein l13_18630 [Neisseria weaveri ATCC 51223]|nr:hypothetical protein l13_18630 [Neisseria weaveri ATCC 51223]
MDTQPYDIWLHDPIFYIRSHARLGFAEAYGFQTASNQPCVCP